MDSPQPITRIGKYQILSEIGRGGMGVVYRANDPSIGREVAIKTLTESAPGLRARFDTEASSGVLRHPNIITVYDYGEHNGTPYMVMEFLQGSTLDQILKSGRPISLLQKLDIIRQVCEGLAHAHHAGIIHRDIKPGNIMVEPSGIVKIVDFGISHRENTSGDTDTGMVIGTFQYLAPERLKGEPVDGRSDIWAVGVVLYQTLTGFLPFAGEDMSSLHKIINEPYPPLSDYLPDYPRGLDAILEKALAKNVDDRYSNADEMALDLTAICEPLKRAQMDAAFALSQTLLEQGNLNAARTTLQELLRLDPQNTEARKLLRSVQEQLNDAARLATVQSLLQQAEEAVNAEWFQNALALYEQIARIDPDSSALVERRELINSLQEKAATTAKVTQLLQQAEEARQRNDVEVSAHLATRAQQLYPNHPSLPEAPLPKPPFPSEPAASTGTHTVLFAPTPATTLLRQDSQGHRPPPGGIEPRPLAPPSSPDGGFTQLIQLPQSASDAGPRYADYPSATRPYPKQGSERPRVALAFSSSTDAIQIGNSVPITHVPFIIGRDPGNGLSIASDHRISRQQCVIDWVDGAYILRDLGSTNGTWLNGHLLGEEPAVLQFGAVIRFNNKTALTFVSSDLVDLPDLTGYLVGGRFKLTELMRGGKKTVLYRGDDQRVPQTVAVKVLSPELASYPGYLAQFKREAVVEARLRHPNIAKIIDFGVTSLQHEPNRPIEAQYICGEFMSGGSLASRIAEHRFLTSQQVSAWLNPITEALDYAHRQGVVHSGLKTSSVIFSDDLTPYLTDFAGSPRFLGAPDFLSPEQWDGRDATAFSDQYSLAALVYTSLAGAPPYKGQQDPDERLRNYEREPNPIHQEAARSGNKGIPAALSDVLARGLARSPEGRYPTIREFTAAFALSLVAPEAARAPIVFLSYQRDTSSGWAALFAAELRRSGMDVFIDVSRQDNAVVFPEWLEKAIAKCDIFVCFLSKSTLASTWVRQEIRIAHKLDKLMIPIFQEDFKHPRSLTDLEDAVARLLNYQGVSLLDRRNIYVDAAVQHLANMIKASLQN